MQSHVIQTVLSIELLETRELLSSSPVAVSLSVLGTPNKVAVDPPAQIAPVLALNDSTPALRNQQLAQTLVQIKTALSQSADKLDRTTQTLIASEKVLRQTAVNVRQQQQIAAITLTNMEATIKTQQKNAAKLRALGTSLGKASSLLDKVAQPLQAFDKLLDVKEILSARDKNEYVTSINNALRKAFIAEGFTQGGEAGAGIGVAIGAAVPGLDATGVSEAIGGVLGFVTGGVVISEAAGKFWDGTIAQHVKQIAGAVYNAHHHVAAKTTTSSSGGWGNSQAWPTMGSSSSVLQASYSTALLSYDAGAVSAALASYDESALTGIINLGDAPPPVSFVNNDFSTTGIVNLAVDTPPLSVSSANDLTPPVIPTQDAYVTGIYFDSSGF